MNTADSTIADLNQAIRAFGTYNLHDKGAHEVMDVESIQNRLRIAGTDDAIATLQALRQHPDGDPLLHALIAAFVEDDEWPELTEALVAVPELRTAFVPWLPPLGAATSPGGPE